MRFGMHRAESQSENSFKSCNLYMKDESNGTPFQYSCLENPMDGGV